MPQAVLMPAPVNTVTPLLLCLIHWASSLTCALSTWSESNFSASPSFPPSISGGLNVRRSAYPPDIVPASSCLLPTGATAHSHRDSLFSSNEIFSLSLFLKSVRLSWGKKKRRKKKETKKKREEREERARWRKKRRRSSLCTRATSRYRSVSVQSSLSLWAFHFWLN